MSCRLAAKAVQEEACKHAYAMDIAIEAIAEHFLTQRNVTLTICQAVVSMHFPADDHALVYWPD